MLCCCEWHQIMQQAAEFRLKLCFITLKLNLIDNLKVWLKLLCLNININCAAHHVLKSRLQQFNSSLPAWSDPPPVSAAAPAADAGCSFTGCALSLHSQSRWQWKRWHRAIKLNLANLTTLLDKPLLILEPEAGYDIFLAAKLIGDRLCLPAHLQDYFFFSRSVSLTTCISYALSS